MDGGAWQATVHGAAKSDTTEQLTLTSNSHTGAVDSRPLLSSVQVSRSVVSDSLQPHGVRRTRPPCPPPTPGVHPNSCPLNWWCHPTISSSVVPFSACPQSFPASGSFLRTHPKCAQICKCINSQLKIYVISAQSPVLSFLFLPPCF